MSLFGSLSISQSGLVAASTQLQVMANNISKAGQEGYTRKEAVLSSASLGTVGGGVKINGFTRATDAALFTTLNRATSNAGLRSTQDDYLQQVMDSIGISSTDDPPLSEVVTEFTNAWTSFSSEPESSVTERQVIQAAVNLVDEIHRMAGEVEALDRQCKEDIISTVDDLNSYLSQIKDLNQKISLAYTSGQSPGDLEDDRDRLILKVSEIANITVLNRENGQIALYSSSGYQLVDGSYARSFEYIEPNVVSTDNTALPLNSALTGGKLQALLDLRDTSAAATSSSDPAVGTFEKMRDQLDAIANAFLTTTSTATSGADTFAAAYNNAALDPYDPTELASDFFTTASAIDLRSFIEVNASLLDGTATIKQYSGNDVVDSLLDATRSFTASGLSATGSSYSTLVTTSITGFQQAASNAATLSATAAEQQEFLSQKLTNETNVNVDTEMVNLVTLQNIYAANARLLTVIKDLLSLLQSTVA